MRLRVLTGSILLPALLGAAGMSEARNLLPPSVLPGLGPSSVRELVDVDRPPWRGVVRVQTELGSHGTGALVGPGLVVIAAHYLFGRGTARLVQPGSVHVLTGYRRGAFEGHSRVSSIAIGAGFAMGLDGQPAPSSPIDADWAVLTLDTALGTADRVLPLMRELPPPGTTAMLGGYEQDRGQVIVADVVCAVVCRLGMHADIRWSGIPARPRGARAALP